MAASLTEREHAELLNQVREMLVWRKWSTEQVSENETQVAESLESLRISNKIVSTVYDVPEKLNLFLLFNIISCSSFSRSIK